jgi:hypothetical protein
VGAVVEPPVQHERKPDAGTGQPKSPGGRLMELHLTQNHVLRLIRIIGDVHAQQFASLSTDTGALIWHQCGVIGSEHAELH